MNIDKIKGPRFYICATCAYLYDMSNADKDIKFCGQDGTEYITSCPGCNRKITQNTKHCRYCGVNYLDKGLPQ